MLLLFLLVEFLFLNFHFLEQALLCGVRVALHERECSSQVHVERLMDFFNLRQTRHVEKVACYL